MRKRTEEQQRKNSAYQSRYRKRRKLKLKILEFLERLNTHLPPGLAYEDMRGINMRAKGLLRLPYRWTEKDLARNFKALDTLAHDVYGDDYEDYTPEYEELSRQVLDNFQHLGGTPAERAKVLTKMMRLVGTELVNAYSEKKPPVKEVLSLVMATGMTPYPEWFSDELAKFVVKNLDDAERKALCEKILQS